MIGYRELNTQTTRVHNGILAVFNFIVNCKFLVFINGMIYSPDTNECDDRNTVFRNRAI